MLLLVPLQACVAVQSDTVAVQQECAKLQAENSCLKRELLDIVQALADPEQLRKLPDAGQEVNMNLRTFS